MEGKELYTLLDTRLKERGVSWRSLKFQQNDKASIIKQVITFRRLLKILDAADLKLLITPKTIN